jgi:hypothetical protein
MQEGNWSTKSVHLRTGGTHQGKKQIAHGNVYDVLQLSASDLQCQIMSGIGKLGIPTSNMFQNAKKLHHILRRIQWIRGRRRHRIWVLHSNITEPREGCISYRILHAPAIREARQLIRQRLPASLGTMTSAS